MTEEGLLVYNKSKGILSGVDALRIKAETASQNIRIGIQEVFSHSIAGEMASCFEGSVELFELDSGEMERHLLEKKIDFGFTFVPFPQKEIEYLKITKVSFASFYKRGAFKNTKTEEVPYVIPSSELLDNPLSFKFRDGWNKDLSRFSPFKANSLSAGLGMVQAGVAAIYIPKFLAKSMNASLITSQQLVEVQMPPDRQAAEITWRDIFLAKTGKETREMKKATRVIRLNSN